MHGREMGGVEWPATDICDGLHPNTGMPCVLGDHKGYHRTADGAKWLDEAQTGRGGKCLAEKTRPSLSASLVASPSKAVDVAACLPVRRQPVSVPRCVAGTAREVHVSGSARFRSVLSRALISSGHTKGEHSPCQTPLMACPA